MEKFHEKLLVENAFVCIFATKKEIMFILVVIALFIAAIVAPYVLPNEKVSSHKKDWEV